MGDFNYPDICRRNNTAGHKQAKRFLECISDNFLTQVIEEPARRGSLLDLVLTNKAGLVRDVEAVGSLGNSNHRMMEFRILQGRSKAKSRITTLGFRSADSGLFRALLGRNPWDAALERRGVQKSSTCWGPTC